MDEVGAVPGYADHHGYAYLPVDVSSQSSVKSVKTFASNFVLLVNAR